MQGIFDPERWVRTGLLWAGMSFALVLLIDAVQGEVVTGERLLVEGGIWAVAGVGFGQALRVVARRGGA